MPTRVPAALSVLLAGSLLVAGCTSADTSPDPAPSATPTPSASAADGPVTLRVGVYGDPPVRRAWRELAATWNSVHPDVTVDLDVAPTAEEALRRLEAGLDAGTAPDVFLVPSEAAPALSEADRVTPVDELLAQRGVVFGDTYLRLGLEAFSAEQALQCMPVDVSPYVVLYHRGLLPLRRLAAEGEDPVTPETGWTWEQFGKAARLMSGDGVKGVYVEPRLDVLMALVRSGGADVVDDPRRATTLTLSDDATREALTEVLDLLREPRLTPTPQQLRRKDGLARFADEQLGMVFATRRAVPELRRAGTDFDVLPLPVLGRPRTVAEVTGLCLSAAGEHQAEAADFLAWATGPEAARVLAETGAVVPAHVPTLNSPAFLQPGEQPESVDVFVDALAGADVHPYVPGWPDVVDAVQSELDQLFYAPVLDLDTLLPRIDEQSRQILAPAAEAE